jgi:hypothetical protein
MAAWVVDGAGRELADIYLNSNPREPDNSRKCLRRFFDKCEISALSDEQEREFFFRLRSYGNLCNPASSDFSEDSAVIGHAVAELLKRISSIGNVAERNARTEAVQQSTLCPPLPLGHFEGIAEGWGGRPRPRAIPPIMARSCSHWRYCLSRNRSSISTW